MASISDLLRYKKKVELKSDAEIVAEVWVRILGDYDLQQAYKQARLASSRRRAALRTVGSDDYNDMIETVPDIMTLDEAKNIVKSAKIPIFVAEAYATLDRDEPPKVEEVSEEPDAPSLEEQEQLDKIEVDQGLDYQSRVKNNVADRLDALDQELGGLSDVEIYDRAKFELSNLAANEEFTSELAAQKAYRGTYLDEKCKTRAFLDIDDFKNTHETIKRQLLEAYEALELGPTEIKNSSREELSQ